MRSSLSAIDSALDRLHFLARAIRKASSGIQEQEPLNSRNDDDKIFRDIATSYVKWKCPHARPSLRDHMGDTIAERRRILLQKYLHALRLKKRRSPKPSHVRVPEQRLMPFDKKHAAKLPIREAANLQIQGGMSHGLSSAAASRATEASKMDGRAALQRIYQKPALSIRSSGSSQHRISSAAEYPDPPRIGDGEKSVQCPYCLEPLSVANIRRGAKNEYWR